MLLKGLDTIRKHVGHVTIHVRYFLVSGKTLQVSTTYMAQLPFPVPRSRTCFGSSRGARKSGLSLPASMIMARRCLHLVSQELQTISVRGYDNVRSFISFELLFIGRNSWEIMRKVFVIKVVLTSLTGILDSANFGIFYHPALDSIQIIAGKRDVPTAIFHKTSIDGGTY